MTKTRSALVALVVLLLTIAGLAATTTSSSAAYPGADGKIAFVRGNQIFTMSPTGANVTRLTGRGKNLQPTWSPNGRRIAYIHERADGRRDVWVMGAFGGNKRAVTRTGDVSSAGASWSPDGRWLAFANPYLSRVRAAAPLGEPQRLEGYYSSSECGPFEDEEPPTPYGLVVDRYLAWSPDGTRIAVYHHDDCQLDQTIAMYDVATGEAAALYSSGGECCGDLEWSDLFWGPSGEFGFTERDFTVECTDDACSMPGRRPLIIYPGFDSRAGDKQGAPSPSGSYMAFSSAASGTARVLRADADGSNRRALANGAQPDWQPVR
jgi:WD40 repeat protein